MSVANRCNRGRPGQYRTWRTGRQRAREGLRCLHASPSTWCGRRYRLASGGCPLTILAIVPTQLELDSFIESLAAMGIDGREAPLGRLEASVYLDGRLTVAKGGLGKAQFGIQTQHMIDNIATVSAVLCIGTSGALAADLSVGDVVVATETVEHDFNRMLSPNPPPRFEGDAGLLNSWRSSESLAQLPFNVHFGPVASGDEGIMSETRANEVVELTGALAVAWEGAGGARACEFSGVPFVEIRGISDLADETSNTDFYENLPGAMKNLAVFARELVNLAPSN
ncbi:MAG: 5'-methylthioadenosine/S-adenosylhomocysteine nucleosidase [SAR202 cluster bacterium]|nr:5'-methylthioadenosine/S-adenosylhomocysteine nucleosidase [SAR202 cluster bacterium]